MKKLLLITLAVCLLITVGCKKKQEDEPPVITPEPTAEATQVGETPEPEASEPIMTAEEQEEFFNKVERSNDPNISEEEKRKLHDEIDEIIKQNEALSSNVVVAE